MSATVPPISSSYWINTSPSFPAFPKLMSEVSVDVAIVGGGITGLTAAVLLQRAGKRVAVVDANRIAEGVTGNTTAHLTEAIDKRYANVARDFGMDGARLVAEASRAAISRIAAFVGERKIDCNFERVPGFLYTENERDLEALHAEYEISKALGLDVEMTRDVPLPMAKAAIRYGNQAAFHVREYLLGLVYELMNGGTFLFEHTSVVDVQDGDSCVVHTEHGTIAAAHTVVAANVPLTRLLLQTKISHYQSYSLAVVVSNPPLNGLFWDTDSPYHYLRSARSLKNSTSVLIVGGEDHKTGSDDATSDRYEKLLSYTEERFAVERVVARWSAQIVAPVDGLPYIGSPRKDHTYVATGYDGNGITFGTVAAMIISDQILGRSNVWSDIFDAGRVTVLASAKDYIKENKDFPIHMVADRLHSPGASAIDDVARGQGKIVDVRGKRLAVYRDLSGAVHACSAVCPHLGCIVHFNAAEATWDCPCHGSRFAIDGSMMNGPATEGLAPYEATDDSDDNEAGPVVDDTLLARIVI